MDENLIRILLVEDNPGDALLVSEDLAEAEPGRFTLEHVDRVSAALARLDEGGVDLVLLDLSLPDSHGLDSYLALRAGAGLVPVVVLTGMSDERLALEAVERGAQDYLVKGQVRADLLARSVRYSIGRSRVERALRESESVMRAFQDASPMMMGVVELVGDDLLYVSHNAVTARHLGLPPEALRGRLASALGVPPERIARWVGRCLESGRSGLPVRHESFEDTPLGPHWIASTVCPLDGIPQGRPRFSYVAEDVTERKQVEEALSASEARFARAVRGSCDGLWDWLYATDEVYFAPRFKALLGYEGDEFPDKLDSFWSRLHPADLDQVRGALAAHRQRGATYDVEYRLLTKSGEYRWFHARGQDDRDGDVAGTRMSGSISDVTDRKHAEEDLIRAEQENRSLNAHLERRLEHISALRSIDAAINSSFDLPQTLEVVLNQVFSQLRVDAAAVWLRDPGTGALSYAVGRGLDDAAATRPPGPDGAWWTRAGAIGDDGFVGYSALPLVSKGKTLGVLEAFGRGPLDPQPEWHDFLKALADQAAIAVENSSLFEGLQRSNLELTLAYDATIDGWSRAVDLRDKETEGHSRRVTDVTLRLARAFGYGDDELTAIRRGAQLHDIGKLGVPDAILLKPGPLTDEEWAVMRRHPEYAHDWLSSIAFLRPSLEIPYCHHEKWDGSGYPRGLKGEQIPAAARMFAAVDICDALLSDRPYRKAWPVEKVRDHLRTLSGSHLDPRVVDAFLPMIGEPGHAAPAGPSLRGGAREAGAAAADPDFLGDAFRAMLDQSDDFVVVVDGSWKILAAGRSFAAAFVPGRDPRGLDFVGLLDSGSRAKFRALLGRPLVGPLSLEVNHLTPSRALRLVNYSVCELPRPAGGRLLTAVGRSQQASLDLVGSLVELNRELEESRRALAEQALSDPLTGLGNRRWLFEQLETLWAQGRRQSRFPWVMMADLDHFKAVNDTYGHHVGDAVLAAASRAMREAVRIEDRVARYGGEEFVLAGLCDHESELMVLADRVLAAVRDARGECPGGVLRITCSLGIVVAVPDPSHPPWAVLQAADGALYRAKAAGRDRFVMEPGVLGRRPPVLEGNEVAGKVGFHSYVGAS